MKPRTVGRPADLYYGSIMPNRSKMVRLHRPMFVQPETMSTILSRPSRATRRQRRASPASASSCAPPPGPGEVSPPRGVAARPARPRSDQRRTCDILCFSWTPHRGPSSELSSDAGLAARQLGFLIHPHHLSALRNESASPDLACSTERRHFPCALVLTPRLVSGCR